MDYTLSFCITTYDGDYHLLPRVWESLRLQTRAPDEIIIVSSGLSMGNIQDGGSIEIAGETVPIYTANSTKRLVPANARNIAEALAMKDIVQFFDADDYLHQNHIQITKEIFKAGLCQALLHSYELSTTVVPPSMATPHSFNGDNLQEVGWSAENRRYSISQEGGHGVACGPMAILKGLAQDVKYREWVFEDMDMVRQLVVEKRANVKHYAFPLMTYFPSNSTGRPRVGNFAAAFRESMAQGRKT